ncbi:4-hydroxy-tetrahydrodipicolinate synthase [Peptoniphilus asaccharolyticus DSM 20463]|uniref:4-hydroxy-tetrahydrodipicolinate synthase n=1 Tax=Peptoniphilus asaccharolyticus DSM 20463 TaxID=573058 RepID=A0A1W1UIB2_PEPAS|nr:4-hydroxy-tetrahydrodipicolinate synthase [Peptoniphilus asaccharolyticus]MBL7574767.1 4-hydroxy-tetrahydrodipicolinate synthase [Peptoniphilus asaccharolyticus]SMB80810.1 4-hydroxy-tetrahydrodipicolinate synthase [Peptoniphilus asaccharolyticus DSM 20463]
MSIFRGSGVALVTPFNEDGNVNYTALDELLEFHLENSTDAIVIVGTTGEASTLTDEEQVEVVKFTVDKVNKKVPVIAGAGSNDTRHGINLSKMIEDVGANALLQVTPYYNKTSQIGLLKHFEAIDRAVKIPMIAYSVPGRTGMGIMPESVVEISKMNNFVAIKDATGDLGYTAKVASLVGDDFDIYSGNDDIVLPLMSLGGVGVISVWANIFPREVHDMCEAFFSGDIEKARGIQLRFKEFIDALFMEPSPIPLKAAMNILGYQACNLRLPLYEASENTKETIKRILKGLGRL